jgi:transaldolase
MKPTERLHDLGQSLWLDNITRDLLTTGTLKHYIDELSVTGLTSNPTIFDHAIKNSAAYHTAIRKRRQYLDSPRWQRAFNGGARPQRLLWASTGTKDPKASDVLYITALAAPFTVNTMPEGTLKALANHGEIGPMLPADGGDCEDALVQFAKSGINIDALAAQLQDDGAKSFVNSWNEVMAVIASKSAALAKAS